jgi:hypothetical protein
VSFGQAGKSATDGLYETRTGVIEDNGEFG